MSATITLDWHECIWYLQGAMAGSHLRWGVYEEFVDGIWKQLDEQERENIYTIAKRDLSWHFEGKYVDEAHKKYFEQLLARFNPSNQYTITLKSRKKVDAYLWDGKYYVGWFRYCAQDAIKKAERKAYKTCMNDYCSLKTECKRFLDHKKGDEVLENIGVDKCDFMI